MPVHGHVLSTAEIGFKQNHHQFLKEVFTKHTDTSVHISTVYKVLLRDWAPRVLDNWKLQKCSQRRLYSFASCKMRKIVLGEKPDPTLIGVGCSSKPGSEIDDVIHKIINPLSLETFSGEVMDVWYQYIWETTFGWIWWLRTTFHWKHREIWNETTHILLLLQNQCRIE